MKIVNIWKFLEFMSTANAPTPGAKMNGKCPTPRAQKTGKSPTLSRGGTLGDSLDTSITLILVLNQRVLKLQKHLVSS